MFDFINYKFVSFLAVILLAFMCFTDKVLADENTDKTDKSDIEIVEYEQFTLEDNIKRSAAVNISEDDSLFGNNASKYTTPASILDVTFKHKYYVLKFDNDINNSASFNAWSSDFCNLNVFFIPDNKDKNDGGYRLAFIYNNKFYVSHCSGNASCIYVNNTYCYGNSSGKYTWYTDVNDKVSAIISFNNCKTNIPIFDSQEHGLAYLQNGSVDGLLNKDDTDLKYTYDSNVPVPENVHIQYNYKDTFKAPLGPHFNSYPVINLCFNENDDFVSNNGSVEVKWFVEGEIYEKGLFGKVESNCEPFKTPFFNSDLIQSKSYMAVGTADGHTDELDFFHFLYNNEDYFKSFEAYQKVEANAGFMYSMFQDFKNITCYVRNITADNRSSDWVECAWNFDSSKPEVTTDNKTNEGTTNIYDGSKDPEDLKPGDKKGSYDISAGDYDKPDQGSVIDWIKNGLGLLGDDGLIHMLGEVFSFLPRPIITILITTVSVCCLIVIVKFIRG